MNEGLSGGSEDEADIGLDDEGMMVEESLLINHKIIATIIPANPREISNLKFSFLFDINNSLNCINFIKNKDVIKDLAKLGI
ncbi:hypothetical protein [Nostoc sp. UHCC 0251]|uniref:hypothetical protein n=1 Tax=Nostoc sp. UHCC 0251 TaxID=3110240 RepID=UPI002B21FC4A|nr:hypothetical protein [Nostoc sp. UHCC 0251]MEA5623527.1 hypothetical protein [Nostoc sp. UHCC 0251]